MLFLNCQLLLAAPVPDHIDLLVKDILVIQVHVLTVLIEHVDSTLSCTLHLKLILITELQQVLLALLKAERSRDLVIHVQLDCLEDDVALVVDNVTKPVDQVTSSIYKTLPLVKQLAAFSSHDDEVTHVIDFKVTHDVSQLEVRDLLLWLENLLLLDLLFLLLGWCTFISR